MEDLVIMENELIRKDDMNKIIKDFFAYINENDELDFEQRTLLSDYITKLSYRLNKLEQPRYKSRWIYYKVVSPFTMNQTGKDIGFTSDSGGLVCERCGWIGYKYSDICPNCDSLMDKEIINVSKLEQVKSD